jgi:anti-sigma B factor antagonist
LDEREATTQNSAGESANCVLSENWDGQIVVVSAAGVVDMLSAPQLQEAIRTALTKSPTAVVIDFTDVEFLASAGMGVLVAAHDEKPDSVTLSVVADGPATSRPLKLVGIADIIELYPTRDEALAAIKA